MIVGLLIAISVCQVAILGGLVHNGIVLTRINRSGCQFRREGGEFDGRSV